MRARILFVAGVAAVAGCVSMPKVRDSQLVPGTPWEATLAPGTTGGVHGAMSVLPLGDDAPHARVTLTITDGAPNTTYAWHIHQGRCGSDGPLVGPAERYVPVPTGAAGGAEMIVELPIRLDERRAYFAHVHEPGTRGVAACGALRAAGAPVLTNR